VFADSSDQKRLALSPSVSTQNRTCQQWVVSKIDVHADRMIRQDKVDVFVHLIMMGVRKVKNGRPCSNVKRSRMFWSPILTVTVLSESHLYR